MSAPEVTRKDLIALVEGEVTPSERQRVEAALVESGSLRREHAALQSLTATLRKADPDLEQPALWSAVQAGLHTPRRRAPLVPLVLWLAAACLVAASGLTFALLKHRPATDDTDDRGFVARSAPSDAASRHAGIKVYVASTTKSSPRPLEGEISRHASLLFAYTNVGPRPFSHLMIFATDDAQRVYWYHPAYEKTGTAPRALAISAQANVALPEAVEHDLPRGRLRIQALFLRRPMTVLDVEALLTRTRSPQIAESALQVIDVQVR